MEEGDVCIVLYTNHACSGIQNVLVVNSCEILQKLETQNRHYILDIKQLRGDLLSNLARSSSSSCVPRILRA